MSFLGQFPYKSNACTLVVSGLSAPFAWKLNSTFSFCLLSSAPLSGSILHAWAWQPNPEANGKKLCRLSPGPMWTMGVWIGNQLFKSPTCVLSLLCAGIVHDALKTERENKNWNKTWTLIMEDEKNISSLVTTVEFLFLIFLNVWCFFFPFT